MTTPAQTSPTTVVAAPLSRPRRHPRSRTFRRNRGVHGHHPSHMVGPTPKGVDPLAVRWQASLRCRPRAYLTNWQTVPLRMGPIGLRIAP